METISLDPGGVGPISYGIQPLVEQVLSWLFVCSTKTSPFWKWIPYHSRWAPTVSSTLSLIMWPTTSSITSGSLCHNHAKHWVDDVNNRRHDPIGLGDVWGTKWWPHLQFTFICSINSPRAKKETAESQLEFHKRLANKMLNNKLDGEGNCPNSPVRPRKRSRESLENEHRFMTRPNFTGSWNKKAQAFAQVKTKYSKLECATCKFPWGLIVHIIRKLLCARIAVGNHIGAVGFTL